MTDSDRLALAAPITPPTTPATELVAPTRRTEARTVMAAVAALTEHSVPIRDIAVVVRDLDPYEEPLFRAAIQYEIAPVFWTQLRVTQTRPYALLEAICDLLDADQIERETLVRPLELRWAPPGGDTEHWPIDPATLERVRRQLPAEPRSLSAWAAVIGSTTGLDSRLGRYAEWLTSRPTPSPAAVAATLGDAIEGYADTGLERTLESDSPARLDTENDARAVVRVRTLIEQLRLKFGDRLEAGQVDRSWSAVADLASVIATQRPGRREHSNARALDVLEANDIWALDIPYVLAVGLTADQWPRPTDSVLPPEFHEAVLRGDGAAGTLAPQPAWVGGRDRDQFIDTLAAARRCVIITRHTRTRDGTAKPPSPLLDDVDTDRVTDAQRRRLVAADPTLPPSLREHVVGSVEGTNE